MGTYQACSFAPAQWSQGDGRPLIVVGITHPQTCLVLRGRLQALLGAGFRVKLICSPGELLDRTAADEGVEAIPIPMRRGFALFSDLVSLVRIWAVLRRLRPDVTEFSTPKAGLLGNVAALLCGVPKRVYLVRGLRLETATGWRRALLAGTERLAAACSHLVMCNSHSLGRQMVALGLAPAVKVQVLGHGSSNGVDVERFSPGASDLRSACSIPTGAPVIGFVGRLTRDKGVPELVQAFDEILARLPEARLLLVGWFDESADALSAAFRKRIDAHPRIVRTGFVHDTAAWYRAMDVLVLPTWREGFPNVALEAAASGIPVVTTRATGACDAVLPEVTGILIPAGDAGAIAESVLKLLSNPQRRLFMGVTARAWVLDCFTQDRVLGRTVELYRTMVRQPARSAAPVLIRDGVAAD